MDTIIEHRKAIDAELNEYLAERIATYAGDFDEWARCEDPDTYGYCLELIQSLNLARELSRSQREHQLEARWDDLYREIAEEYAHAAAFDRECGRVRPYADRRGW